LIDRREVVVSCEICGLRVRLIPPDDEDFLAAHEQMHRKQGDIP
jgi:hypothetical protein